MHFIKIAVLFVIFGLAHSVQSQNLGLTSYSRIGIGELADPGSSRNIGLGGAGSALIHAYQQNALNPASLSALRYTNFEFDLAGKRTSYVTSRTGSQTGAAVNVQYFAIALPVHKKATIQFGAKPFSSIAYEDDGIQAPLDAGGNPVSGKQYFYSNSGNGGLSDMFFGIGLNHRDWLRAGLNAGIVLGQSVYENQTEDSRFRYNNSVEKYEKHLRLTPGILISNKIIRNELKLALTDSVAARDTVQKKIAPEIRVASADWYYGIAVTGTFFQTLQADEDRIFKQSVYEYNGTYYQWYDFRYDTLSSGKIRGYQLPFSYRIGLSIYQPSKLSFALDYNFTKWSSFSHNLYRSTTADQHTIALGAEYIPKNNSINFLERVAYRAGLSTTTLPYKIEGQTINQVQANVGAGFTIIRGQNVYILNTSLAYGQRGTTSNNLVKENYFLMTVGIACNTRWFVRRRHD